MPARFSIFIAMAAFILMIQSCEKQVKFDVRQKDKGVVLNAILKQDSTVFARITFLKALNEQMATEPAAAIIQLFEDGVWKEDLSPTIINGIKYYGGNTKTISGHDYRLAAKIEGYALVDGTDIIPEAPVTSGEQIQLISTANDGDKLNIAFVLQDQPQTKNYYRLQVIGRRLGPGYPNNPDSLPQPVYYTFKNADFGGRYLDGYPEEYTEYYFDDALFNGQNKEIKVEFFPADAVDTNTYQLVVTALSESTYRYFKSKQASIDNNGDPFTEPSVILSNIKNGFGIVGGLSYRRFNLKL